MRFEVISPYDRTFMEAPDSLIGACCMVALGGLYGLSGVGGGPLVVPIFTLPFTVPTEVSQQVFHSWWDANSTVPYPEYLRSHRKSVVEALETAERPGKLTGALDLQALMIEIARVLRKTWGMEKGEKTKNSLDKKKSRR